MGKPKFIGMDIGGTNTALGLIDESGNVIGLDKISTQAEDGPERILDRYKDAIGTLIAKFDTPLSEITAVGAGVPGFVDHETGVSVHSVNLGWRNLPFAEHLSRRLNGIPVFINNDVRMYVYGEAMFGAGKGYEHVLGVTVGTGLAAALVSGGQLYHGAVNMAGELGHIPMDGIPYKCRCGLTGCLETVASATGLIRQAKDRIAAGEKSILTEWYDDMEKIEAKDLSRAYDLGDALSISIMQNTGMWLGKGLAYAVSLLSPDVVMIGGGVAAAGDRLMNSLRETMRKNLIENFWNHIEVVTVERDNEAGVLGSAMYACERSR